jgi:8-oxo-dGTP pyrophosphatase MutT (NUDIX family)
MTLLPLAAVSALALASHASRRGGSAGRLIDEGHVGGHWGSQGAGALLTTGRRILLMLRSDLVDYEPHTWGVPGGAVPVDSETGRPDDLVRSAARELREEAGLNVGSEALRDAITGQTVFRSGSFRFTTFIARVSERSASKPLRLNWESEDAGWFTPEELLDLELHPGVRFTLDEAWDTIFDPDAPGADLRGRI